MKVVQINTTCGLGSTGKICLAVSKILSERNIENYILYSSGESTYPMGIKYSSAGYVKLQTLRSRLLGNYGFNSVRATKKLIQELEKINPDIVHIHNIHSHDCNLGLLFSYLKKKNVKIFWTFHDCWAFTGYCPHFTMVKCGRWKTGCGHCVQYKQFSWLFDRSDKLFQKKKELFSNLNLIIVTPSQWLADLIKESFLNTYPVKVIHNGIDLSIFKPTVSDFRTKNKLENKIIVLGVAFGWDARKGLDVFIELSQLLNDDYKIVLIGTDKKVDALLPDNILSIHRTNNQTELAEIYSATDVFVNPTREENYPTVNMEAIACGTPVITFDAGGSSEMLDENCGVVIAVDDVENLRQELLKFNPDKYIQHKEFLCKRLEYREQERFFEYANLYQK